MTKKITFTLLVMLVVSAFVFVSCQQEQVVPGPAPVPKEPVVNELGEVSANLVFGGDFENGDDHDVADDGSEIAVTPGAGIDDSAALYVFQNSGGGWGEVLIDITKFYGRGKSYYVEASFKNLGGEDTPTSDITAHIDFTLVSGAGYDKYKKTYDIPGQYDYGWLSDDDAAAIFEIPTSGSAGVDISDGEWHKLSAILDAETIDTMISTQTQDHGTGSSAETLYYMAAVFFVGSYPSQDGYKYYLDNIVIKDLNAELDRTGKTWEDPTAAEEEEEEE